MPTFASRSARRFALLATTILLSPVSTRSFPVVVTSLVGRNVAAFLRPYPLRRFDSGYCHVSRTRTMIQRSASSSSLVDPNHVILDNAVDSLQDIIGTDAGGRGMASLIVPGDLRQASTVLANLLPPSHVLILSGFPCCVHETPPTETDGPPGTLALARAAVYLGHKVTVVTDVCNEAVFDAAVSMTREIMGNAGSESLSLQVFSAHMTPTDDQRLEELAQSCNLIIACERAGPAMDGHCYTMRGIDMTEKGLIAPLHRLVELSPKTPFLAIGDGGNELGMGKVYPQIVSNPKIQNGNQIACAVAADYLVAASVSNWGGYALAAGAALMKAKLEKPDDSDELSSSLPSRIRSWVDKCLPTEADEVALLHSCVKVGCRDGVSGKVEATVDGMPLETSMECLRNIRETALATSLEVSS